MSGFLKLNLNDLFKGAIVAAIVALLGALQQALNTQGIDVRVYDWAAIGNASLVAGVGYILKNLLTNTDGKFLGKI